MNAIMKSLLLFCMLTLSLLTSGCWTSTEITERAVISAAAVDTAETTGKIALTMQFVNPAKVRQGGEDAIFIVSEVADTLFIATRKVQEQVSRKPFWGQMQVFIIGEEQARQGIAPILDFLDRDFEPNRRTWILIAKGTTGKSILQAGFGFSSIPANEVVGLVRQVEASGRIGVSNLNDVLMNIESEGKSVATAYLELSPEKEIQDNQVDRKQKAVMKGMAAFRHGHLVGYLDDCESRGYAWVTNKVKNVAVVVGGLDGPGDKIGVEIISANTKLKPEIQDGKIIFSIDVAVEAHITDVKTKTTPDLTKPEVIDSLNRKLATSIRNEIESAVKKAQTLQTDIFGFGETLARAYPKVWPNLTKDWDLYIFPKIEVHITTKASIVRTGFLYKPVQAK